ncbi:uncharacterized protein LOC132179238 [Corylus avellana]|uniref:uncharacterized protein LOC132179238 n=1 Tax=Corylus avellana TaxID=13451 RepID=UPI00286B8DA2|nr:uncharacterized protein LOC132179238 [Corylus avellana]
MDKHGNVWKMGNSVPVSTTSDSALKLQRSISCKLDRVLIESPIKKNKVKGQNSIAGHGLKPQPPPISHVDSFRELSAKEEIYFDPRSCPESDCEDFFSISSDTTPSCGNTPIHQSSCKETPEPLYVNSTPSSNPEPPPTDMKKQLFELFQESFRGDAVDHGSPNLQGRPIFHIPPKSTNQTLYASLASSECSSETTTPKGSYNPGGKGKLAKSARCCLPNLVRSLSFNGRRKRLSLANSRGR